MMTKGPWITAEWMRAHQHLTSAFIANMTGYPIRYVRHRASQVGVRLADNKIITQRPESWQRRCACGRLFMCRDPDIDRMCEGCIGAFAEAAT